MPAPIRVIVIVIGSIFGLAVGIIVFLVIWFHFLGHSLALHESQTRTLLGAEISKIPVPTGCKKTSQTYKAGNVGTNSAWHVQYTCDHTALMGTTHDAVIAALASQGFREVRDGSKPDNPALGMNYNFTYESPQYSATYTFNPVGGFTAYPEADIPNAPIDTIELDLTRTIPQ